MNFQDFTKAAATTITSCDGFNRANDGYDFTLSTGEEITLDIVEINRLLDINLCPLDNVDVEFDYDTFCDDTDTTPFNTDDSTLLDWCNEPTEEHPHYAMYRDYAERQRDQAVEDINDWNVDRLNEEAIGKTFKTVGPWIDTTKRGALTSVFDGQAVEDGTMFDMNLYLQERTTEAWETTVAAAIKVGRGKYWVATTQNVDEHGGILAMWHVSGDEAELWHSKHVQIHPTLTGEQTFGRTRVTFYPSWDEAIADLFDRLETIEEN
jgi:hypothetical protein